MAFKFTEAYSPLFYSKYKYFIISGGRGGGKSKNLAAYYVMKLYGADYFRGVVSRYTGRDLKHSIYQDIKDIIIEWNLTSFFEISGDQITNKANKNQIITHSFRIGDNAQVAKGKGLSNCTHLLVDEATEIPTEAEYIKTCDSFRTIDADIQIILLFNPTDKRHWIYTRFYDSDKVPKAKWTDTHCFIHTTYKDCEEYINPDKIKEWEDSINLEGEEYYNHEILGHWSNGMAGAIFKGWQHNTDIDTSGYSCVYGLDFGFANDPAAVIKVERHNQRMVLTEICYHTGLTNPELFKLLVARGVPLDAVIIADSAEPKSIKELKDLGFKNIKACYKGRDSITNGIAKIKEYEIFVNSPSENLWKEFDKYCWKPGTTEPIDEENHLMDSLRYSLSGEKRTYPKVYTANSVNLIKKTVSPYQPNQPNQSEPVEKNKSVMYHLAQRRRTQINKQKEMGLYRGDMKE